MAASTGNYHLMVVPCSRIKAHIQQTLKFSHACLKTATHKNQELPESDHKGPIKIRTIKFFSRIPHQSILLQVEEKKMYGHMHRSNACPKKPQLIHQELSTRVIFCCCFTENEERSIGLPIKIAGMYLGNPITT